MGVWYGDIGAGTSRYTFQLAAGPRYAFDWGDVLVVCRYLEFDGDSGCES
jgi:hypothetical protein